MSTLADEVHDYVTRQQNIPDYVNDLFCKKAGYNLMCNAVASLDDPDDYAHYGPGNTTFAKLDATNQFIGTTPFYNRNRGTVLDRVVNEKAHSVSGFPQDNHTPQLSYMITNFALAAPEADATTPNVTRLYANIFAPYYCNNPGTSLHDRWDSDGDSVADACDNCPLDYNPGQEDRNLDNVGDACDVDGDGVPGTATHGPDNCWHTFNPNQVDSDHDGRGDACAACAAAGPGAVDGDHDGIVDVCDNCPGLANTAQADSDGDGIGDSCDNCPQAVNPDQHDVDNDGRGDLCDACGAPEDGTDSDGDHIPDACDNCPGVKNLQSDSDGDGVGDECDNCPYVSNPTQTDGDHDGRGDACDACAGNPDAVDHDKDGIPDACDRCPNVASTNNDDTDNDGIGDACDNCPTVKNRGQVDYDCDGLGDACDNCQKEQNSSQLDFDQDGVGDACDGTACKKGALLCDDVHQIYRVCLGDNKSKAVSRTEACGKSTKQ